MMRIMVKKAISIVFIVEILILAISIFSLEIFTNVQVAFLSSFLVIVGSSLAYSKMVVGKIESENFEDDRDILDEIDDPYELYSEDEIDKNIPIEDLDFKAIVKEEKAKIKTFSFSSIKHGAKGSVSVYRIVPYIFLILGFIALKNNEILNLAYYLPSLLIGIVLGSILSKELV